MPSRNAVKQYSSHSYYHVYNRGVAKQPIFSDAADKKQFLAILSRYLDPANTATKLGGVPYRKFDKDIELLCYCLMGNHFHMLVYINDDETSLTRFMQSILTAYTMYFNKRHRRVGTLFQGVYKASRISQDSYLIHISRYIHMNPRRYETYRYSSLAYYVGKPMPPWLRPGKVLELFEGSDYLAFVKDYNDHKTALEELKYELADT